MASWKTSNNIYKQYSFQYTNPNATDHGMFVNVFPYDGTDTSVTNAAIEFDNYAVPFTDNTYYFGAPVAPDIADPALTGAKKLLAGASIGSLLMAAFYY